MGECNAGNCKLITKAVRIDFQEAGGMAVPVKSPRCNHPEAITNILVRILEKTPLGGATIEDLEEAYEEVKGIYPSRKTIYRALERLELLFDPLARGESPEEGEDPDDERSTWLDDDLPGPLVGIKRVKRNRKTYYVFEGQMAAPAFNINESLYAALSLYPQYRGMLKDAYHKIMRKLLAESLAGVSIYNLLINEIENHVHVAEPVPADPKKFTHLISEIFTALRQKNRIKIKYLRTYDGVETERIVEPYGLLNRFNNFYLTGYCLKSEANRIFHVVHIRELTIIEDSHFRMPSSYSLKRAYSQAWATWTSEGNVALEDVRIRVCCGTAERFRVINFHESQKVRELENGEIEITFRLTGASEMVPWIASWGPDLMVLEPQWLREAVVAYLQKALDGY
jgi:predicted DNA-binding transcriptional regulator YafY